MGASREVRGVHDAALRSDREEAPPEAGGAQPFLDRLEVRAHHGLERSVDTGARGAPVLAQRRVQAVGERVGDARQVRIEQSADPLLVGRVDYRPEQAHPHRLDLGRAHAPDGLDGDRVVEGLVLDAVGPDPPRHLEGEPPRHQRLGKGHGVVEGIDPAALAQQQNVGMPLARHEGNPAGAAGEHRVRRARRRVHEEPAAPQQFSERDAGRAGRELEHVEHPPHRVVGGGGRLEQLEATVLVLDHEVGEGPAHISRQPHSASFPGFLPSHVSVVGQASGFPLTKGMTEFCW